MCIWYSYKWRLGCSDSSLYRFPGPSGSCGTVETRTTTVTWLVFKSGIEKAWVWLKHNWKIPFLVVWSLGIYILSRRNTEAIKDVLESNKRSHREEVETLNRAHKDEILKLKNLQKEYKDTIFKLEKKFKEENRKLSKKHAEDVKEIVIKSKGNPEEIIRKIENDFGIKFKT